MIIRPSALHVPRLCVLLVGGVALYACDDGPAAELRDGQIGDAGPQSNVGPQAEAGASPGDAGQPEHASPGHDAGYDGGEARDAAPVSDASVSDANDSQDSTIPMVLSEVQAMTLPDGGKVCSTVSLGMFELRDPELRALEGCTAFRGDLRMGDSRLTKASFPSSLRVVEGTLNFFRNEQLVDISALRNLTEVGRLLIHHNYQLETLTGLENLRKVRGELLISSNTLLRSLVPLSALETVGQEVTLLSNDALPDSEVARLRKQVRIVPFDAGP